MIDAKSDLAKLGLNVSRETELELNELALLITKWNKTINLVSKSTVDDLWSRHILDSAQIFSHGKSARIWADLGSGGGLPGLVVAILAKENAPDMQVFLVESDQRKAVFLRQASQTLGLSSQILTARIEDLAPMNADIVSARALAPLPDLCSFAARHLSASGKAIFLKGKSVSTEITDARKDWNFVMETHTSVTDPSATVLVLKGLSHV